MIKKLGKYKIVEEIGRGAMGVVYKGLDPKLDRTVAIKTIKKSALETDAAEEILARFEREAQSAGRLSHPNIVVIYDYGEAGDTAFIVMGFVEGRELKSYFNNRELFSLPAIVNIMTQLLDALDFAHQEKIVHRDIKPGNIIVKPDGQIMITDFGIAKVETSDLTQIGSPIGTPNYMSPEQCLGQRVDGRSDIFSAGVIFYQLLTGEKPFYGESTTSIHHNILNVDPITPTKLNLQIPRTFDDIIAKALAKRPEDRYQSAAEFSTAIEKAVAPLKKKRWYNESIYGSRKGCDDVTEAESAASRQRPKRKGKKGLIFWIFLLILLGSAGGAYWYTMQTGTDIIKALRNGTLIIKTKTLETGTDFVKTLQAGSVSIDTVPSGVEIFVDGQIQSGKSPYKLKLEPGRHELLLTKEGYHDMALIVDMQVGEKIPLLISMPKK